jgi:predicted neuraminidase
MADGRFRESAIPGMREAYIPIVFPSAHAASLVELANGDVLCSYYSGRWENTSDLGVVVARLRKGSTEWTRPEVADHLEHYAFQNPVLFEAPGGPVWLFHTSQKEHAGEGKAEIYAVTSEDSGKSWSQRKLIFPPSVYDRQPMVVAGDRWLLPIYFTPRKKKGDDILDYSAVQVSTDRGVTWKVCEVPESKGLAQPNVIALDSGHFVLYLRSRFADWIYQSTSTDGCNWTEPKPSQLPNNNASMQAVRLKNGHLVMAFNNTQKSIVRGTAAGRAKRMPLTVALSTDNGATWSWVRDIETGNKTPESPVPQVIAGVTLDEDERQKFNGHMNTYEYPAILQTASGEIMVAYSYHRRTVKAVIFSEGWIKEGGGSIGVFQGAKTTSR